MSVYIYTHTNVNVLIDRYLHIYTYMHTCMLLPQYLLTCSHEYMLCKLGYACLLGFVGVRRLPWVGSFGTLGVTTEDCPGVGCRH